VQTTKFLGDDRGHIRAIELVDVEWVKDNGRAAPRNKAGSERIVPAQLVLLALGFSGPESQLLDQLGVEKDARTNARAEHGKFMTSVPGIFAAGDMRRGQSLVVWAINEGRGAARECDRYLMGETALP
jgi:glutamate synthase (NADPH/NADH) small chain